MEIDIWFPFYYGDYLKDTMQLSAERHGIYLLLLIHCWQNGSIEDDIDSISIIAKVQNDSKSLLYILDKYFVKKGDKYYQNRITKELKCARENKAKNIERAKIAAKARWNKDATSSTTSIPLSNATSVLESCPSPSSSSSQLSIQTESTDNKDGDKSPSRKKFIKPTIFELERYCKDKEYKVDCEAFILHYESNGWLVGKNKMKSWQSALGTWNKNSFSSNKNTTELKWKGEANFEL